MNVHRVVFVNLYYWLLLTTVFSQGCFLDLRMTNLKSANLEGTGPFPVTSPDIVFTPAECDATIDSGLGGGDGTIINPFRICSTNQWKYWVQSGSYLDSHIKLESDLDFSTLSSTDILATGTTGFSGVLDGNGKSLAGLNLSGLVGGYGLIKKASGNAVIKNLNLKNFMISTASGRAAALVLDHTSGTIRIENVNAENIVINYGSGNLTGIGAYVGLAEGVELINIKVNNLELNFSDASIEQIGALVGAVVGGSKTQFTNLELNGLRLTEATGSVVGPYFGIVAGAAFSTEVTVSHSIVTNFFTDLRSSDPKGVGGLLGAIGDFMYLTNQFKIESVHVSGEFNRRATYSGGLVGRYYLSGGASKGEIINSSFTSLNERDGGRSPIGGLVGLASSGSLEIKASYSKGNLRTSDNVVGGLIGSVSVPVLVEDSYVQGDQVSDDSLSGTARLGGLIGLVLNNGVVTIRRSYYSGSQTFSNQAPERGCLIGNYTGSGLVSQIEDAVFDSTACTSDAINLGPYSGATGVISPVLKNGTSIPNWSTLIWTFTLGLLPELIH